MKKEIINKLLEEKAAKLRGEKLRISLLKDKAMQNKTYFSLNSQKNILEMEISLCIFNGKDCNAKEKELKKIKKEMTLNLKSMGISPADFEIHYDCPACKDSGYVNGALCDCINSKLSKLILSSCGMPENPYSFENKNFCALPEAQKEFMDKLYSRFIKYCNAFPDIKYPNALFAGFSGTGKTVLTFCILKKLAEKNFDVKYTTAFSLNNAFLNYHTDFKNKKSLDEYLFPDLLVIDDLGTEPILKNVTLEYIYLILNERMISNKATIITTNLDLNGILNRYGERIFSRITNKSNTFVCRFSGEDIRKLL